MTQWCINEVEENLFTRKNVTDQKHTIEKAKAKISVNILQWGTERELLEILLTEDGSMLNSY